MSDSSKNGAGQKRDWSAEFNAGSAKPLRVHLIGVAGSGMSGLASLFLRLGHKVSGSDRVTTEETERLQGAGLAFSCPHTAEPLVDVDVVIRSSAIKEGNVAYDVAVAAGIPMLLRAEALAALLNGRKGIVVAGTHGKTTTSALAAHVLRVGGVDPSHYVGAEIPILGSNAHWSLESEWFVAEGDESDGTLVNYHPEISILLNVEAEHLDHYSGIEEILEVFGTLLEQTHGKVIYCAVDEHAAALGAKCGERGISYGWDDICSVSARDVQRSGRGTEFTLCFDGEAKARVRLGIPGEHNVLNALAAAALARELGVDVEAVAEAFESFRGARRRFETKYRSDRFRVVDDYGHHPTEIRATLETADSLGAKRTICLFQPHRYSRTQRLRDEFAGCFTGVDELYITDIYPASEQPIEGVTGATLVEAVAAHGDVPKVESHPDRHTLHLVVGNRLREGDLVLTLGAGNIHEVGTRLAADLAVLERMREAMEDEQAVLKLYEPMRKHTTLRVGGPARYWVEPTSEAGFAALIRFCRREDLPVQVIGRGSNLLIRDGGIDGVVVHPVRGELGEVSVVGGEGGTRIHAGVGAKFKKVAGAAQAAGLGGFEWMEGIPGNVGGGIRMNAGAMGAETFGQVISVRFIDAAGEIHEKSVDEIEHHYRNVPEFTRNYVVSAVFEGEKEEASVISERMDASREKRRTSQPVAASAGCIFKNPDSIAAGQLVDELGFKDRAVGAARVSEVHGNFIVNEGGASAAEVLELIGQIQAAAKSEREIELDTEVQIMGQDEAI
jgi:UDP-N-acetylmuramate--L-alanine ligase/UDP-N-acetylenolpyruvoylglucosamine reductase